MGIPQNRMSTTVVATDILPPDDASRALIEDFEKGPIALNDTTQGLRYQDWHLTWSAGTGRFTVTPESGAPVVLTAIAPVFGVTQCSFAFDQTAHVNVTYKNATSTYLYWYDTDAASWVTDALGASLNTPTLCLDDKRPTQPQSSDVMLWYTKQQPSLLWNLYKRQQRERFLIEQLMSSNVPPLVHKLGMSEGLRLQLQLRYTI